jgi:hypothetical protein
MNRLFDGDSLAILCKNAPDDGVELVSMDPPFKSTNDDNFSSKNETGHGPRRRNRPLRRHGRGANNHVRPLKRPFKRADACAM